MPTILLELKTEEFGIRDGSSHQQIVELLAGRVLDSFRCRLLFALDSILETQMNCPGCAACADFPFSIPEGDRTPGATTKLVDGRVIGLPGMDSFRNELLGQVEREIMRLQSFAEHLREA